MITSPPATTDLAYAAIDPADVGVTNRDNDVQFTDRVSVDSTGAQGNSQSGDWRGQAVSADGRYVAFASDASNLVPGDTNGTWDVFLRDRVAGTTTRLSVADDESQANRESIHPSISADGRYVAFSSYAANLVAGDTNDMFDIFVRDTVAGTTTRASVGPAGGQSNYGSWSPRISADGRVVAFLSYATNLVAGDTNGVADVFVRVLW